MKKLAIIGASYLQEPLIKKAKSMGLETHVFAWKAGDVGERSADHFYPISIVEKEAILEQCLKIRIDGICSIASDLAMVTVNYVAEKMGLVGNSIQCTEQSTNKYKMRRCFMQRGDPSPRSWLVNSLDDLHSEQLKYPVIVKPTDRSGSRGIMKLMDADGLADAIAAAKAQSFEKQALVEEFARGQEYSVEYISWHGDHQFLAITKKYTTDAPHFIETGHVQPAPVSEGTLLQVKQVVSHALDSLEIQNGASHTELKIDEKGTIRLIEIGGRMGGDCIGSDLVELSTGIDFVRAVIQVSLGIAPEIQRGAQRQAAIRFIFDKSDLEALEKLKRERPELLVREDIHPISNRAVLDSSSRNGYFLMCGDQNSDLERYMPKER